jgi:hypothetical protein
VLQLDAEIAGRFAALGEGEVCAVFQRSCYLRIGARFACIGDTALGRGPLNALMREFRAPALGERATLSAAAQWQPTILRGAGWPLVGPPARVPEEGFGCLLQDKHNALAVHAQPALEAFDAWLAGNALDTQILLLVGLGPGLTPSGDDYLGGALIALHCAGRARQADSLWRWLAPQLSGRTSAISAAHLEAAAAGEGHEALHAVLNGSAPSMILDGVGHCSGWDALAGAAAVLRPA